MVLTAHREILSAADWLSVLHPEPTQILPWIEKTSLPRIKLGLWAKVRI